MDDKLSDQVSRLLEQFGGSAERVWPVMVQATQFDSAVKFGVGLGLLVVGAMVAVLSWLSGSDDETFAGLIFGGCISVFGGCLALIYVTGVFYPESVLVARLLSK